MINENDFFVLEDSLMWNLLSLEKCKNVLQKLLGTSELSVLYTHIVTVMASYDSFTLADGSQDSAHSHKHAIDVVTNAVEIFRENTMLLDGSEEYDRALQIVVAGAAYHDIGLLTGVKDGHDERGAELVYCSRVLTRWLTQEQLDMVSVCVRDHRKSKYVTKIAAGESEWKPGFGNEEQSWFACVVADADRCINAEVLLYRYLVHKEEAITDNNVVELIKRVYREMKPYYHRSGENYIKFHMPVSRRVEKELQLLHNWLDSEQDFEKQALFVLESHGLMATRKVMNMF